MSVFLRLATVVRYHRHQDRAIYHRREAAYHRFERFYHRRAEQINHHSTTIQAWTSTNYLLNYLNEVRTSHTSLT